MSVNRFPVIVYVSFSYFLLYRWYLHYTVLCRQSVRPITWSKSSSTLCPSLLSQHLSFENRIVLTLSITKTSFPQCPVTPLIGNCSTSRISLWLLRPRYPWWFIHWYRLCGWHATLSWKQRTIKLETHMIVPTLLGSLIYEVLMMPSSLSHWISF